MLYIGAILVVYVPVLVVRLLAGHDTQHLYVISFSPPLQGVLNVLIYADVFSKFKGCLSSLARFTKAFVLSLQEVKFWKKSSVTTDYLPPAFTN